jgi:hypothetical protein
MADEIDHAQEALAWMEAISWHHDEGMNAQAQATVALAHATLDVADAIRSLREDIGVCPHGSTGICMYCMRDFMAVRS